jgi:exodeoxyribonuclease VII small subunit
MTKTPNYTEAFGELQNIIAEIEDGGISLDRLAEKVKRAAFLIRICQEKLRSTEGDVNKILAELASPDESPDGATR